MLYHGENIILKNQKYGENAQKLTFAEGGNSFYGQPKIPNEKKRSLNC